MNVVGQIITRLEDPAYLFVIALVILIGGATIAGNPTLGVMILMGGFALIVLLVLRDRASARAAMSVALRFPPDVEGHARTLTSCECVIEDPRHAGKVRRARVRPLRAGQGWICPLPLEARPSDVVELTITASDGALWRVQGFVLELNWPTVDVEAQ